MALGLIGKKVGMTRLFRDSGEAVQVTVIHVEPNKVTQIKTNEKEGYRALQVSMGSRRATRVTKARAGHFAKANLAPGRVLREFRLSEAEGKDLAVGSELKADLFKVGQLVDVTTELSKGKGFQGCIKRHNFRMQDASHGNSVSHRVPGSTGQRQSPGRVFKGKKMSGHMGAVRRTTQNQEVVQIDTENNLILIRGGVPGPAGGDVVIKPAAKGGA
jgi:large subunit ribosomal protein L3